MKLIIDIDEKDYEELNIFYILNLGTEEYRKIIEKHCTDAIRNGTPYNPTGDCISREQIRENLNKAFGCENATKYGNQNAEQQNVSYSTLMLYEIADIVEDCCDNAPTVPLPNEQITWEQGYEAGLAQGKQDRPKGEWKLVERDNQDIDVVCPFCNRTRFPAYSHGYTIEELEEYLIRQHLPNFCEDCGADMRKGGAE